jgi:hypothetical protein
MVGKQEPESIERKNDHIERFVRERRKVCGIHHRKIIPWRILFGCHNHFFRIIDPEIGVGEWRQNGRCPTGADAKIKDVATWRYIGCE